MPPPAVALPRVAFFSDAETETETEAETEAETETDAETDAVPEPSGHQAVDAMGPPSVGAGGDTCPWGSPG